jgi:hypothetical protein
MGVMTRGDFLQLLQAALNLAADNAEAKLRKAIPRSFLIRLHAFGCDDRLIPSIPFFNQGEMIASKRSFIFLLRHPVILMVQSDDFWIAKSLHCSCSHAIFA